MMLRLLLTIILLSALAPAEEMKMEAAVRQLLETNGAPVPLAITVADRKVKGLPELLITHVGSSDRSLILALRCRLRTQCGDVIATARYGCRDLAAAAFQRLISTQRQVEKAPFVIHTGQSVKLVLQSQSLRLELPVRALNSGAISQTVRVRDPETRRIYRAVVIGANEVRSLL